MAEGIEIKGLSELKAKLDDLSKEAADRCIRTALRAGAAVEQAAIVERAPVKDETGGMLPPGALKNDFSTRIVKDQNTGILSAIIGPGKLTSHVARWVEYGHRIVRSGTSRLLRNGKKRGKGTDTGKMVPAHPFIRPAYEATRQEVIDTITKTLASEIEQAAKKK